jgi:hypothetical protein
LNQRRLVLISYHFPPAGGNSAAASVRLGKFAQYLPEYGWSPLVVTADEHAFDLRDESLVFASHTAVCRVRDPIGRFRGRDRLSPWLPAPGLFLPWAIRAAQVARGLARTYQPELVLASSPPIASFVAGYLAQMQTRLPLVLDYRDQWTLSPYRSGPTLLCKWDRWLESRVLKCARRVIVSNDGRLSEHEAFWGKLSPPSSVVPNGYDGRDLASVQPDRVAAQSLESEVVIRHLGAIYGPRVATTRSLLAALNAYLLGRAEAPTVKVQFTGVVPDDLFRLDSALSSRLILEHRPRALRREALQLEMGADVLLLLIGRHAQANAETSSKVFEYLTTGRPILVGGESALLREFTAGVDRIFWAGDEPSPLIFARFFDWLSEHGRGVPSDRALAHLQMQYPAYDRRNIANQLAVILDGV